MSRWVRSYRWVQRVTDAYRVRTGHSARARSPSRRVGASRESRDAARRTNRSGRPGAQPIPTVMQTTIGILDLATRAACRALASWQELVGASPVPEPPSGGDACSPGATDRHAA